MAKLKSVKVRKFWGLIYTFGEVVGKKTVRRPSSYGLEILKQCGKRFKSKSQTDFKNNSCIWINYIRKNEGAAPSPFS